MIRWKARSGESTGLKQAKLIATSPKVRSSSRSLFYARISSANLGAAQQSTLSLWTDYRALIIVFEFWGRFRRFGLRARIVWTLG